MIDGTCSTETPYPAWEFRDLSAEVDSLFRNSVALIDSDRGLDGPLMLNQAKWRPY